LWIRKAHTTRGRLMVHRALAAVGAGVVLLFGNGAQAQEGAVPRGGTGAVVTAEAPAEEPKKPVIKEPELIEFVNATYPPEAMKQGIEANVGLLLTIDKEGRVTNAESPEPVGNGFDEAAIAAARQFRFKPATRDDKPVATKIRYLYKFTLTTVQAPPPPPPTTGHLVGRLRLSETDAAVAGAELLLVGPDGKERRVTTDAEGRFRAEDVPPGAYKVRIALDGFDPVDSTEDVVAGDETDVTFRLSPKSEGVEVVVRGERPPREVTRRTVSRREMERIPGTSGDALRSIQSLPGVARPPPFAGLLIVRGSAPEDTQQFIDGASVPIIYHFGGLRSVVPTELLERIDFYPGNFSARYGRAGGGIVDVALRAPDTRCLTPDGKPDAQRSGCFHALAQVDLLEGRALVQGPLPMKGWSFAGGIGRSWVGTWLKPILEAAGAGVTTAPVYYDYQLIAEHQDEDSRTSIRFYGSDDRVEFLIEDPAAQDPAFGGNLRFGTAFYRGQIVHESKLNSKVSVTGELAIGKDAANFSLGTFFFKFQAIPITTRYELSYRPIKGAKINVGLDFEMADFDVSVRFPQPPRPGEPAPGPYANRPPIESKSSGFAFRPAWYGEIELEPIDRLRIVPGARVDYARDSGHGDFSPRITARADLIKGRTPEQPDRRRTTLKGGVGLFHQPPQFPESDDVFGTPNLYSNRFTHYTIGGEQELTRNIDLSVEGYYKDLDRMVSRTVSGGSGYVYNNEGTGVAYGAETLIKYRPDSQFFGWLAYTLSRSERRDGPGQKKYLFQFDQTHNLTVLGSYRLGRGWEFGARFRLVSGNLETPVVRPPSLPALYAADAGAYAPIQGEPFSERLPLFHQLDIRVDKRWQFKGLRLSTYLDVQNVYNNPAKELTAYNFDFSHTTYQTGLPILPILGIRLEI
jgi:TonB family protein